jgi:hypothetical protein
MTKQREQPADVDSLDERAIADKSARTKRPWRRFWVAIALSPIVLPLLFYGCIRIAHPNAGPQNIRVSRETTHVTEPIDEEGFVNYVAAINLRQRASVTPENNAGVLLVRAFGRYQDMPGAYWDEFYRELGIDPLPPRGDYFVDDSQFAEEHPELLPDAVDAADIDEPTDARSGFDSISDPENIERLTRQLNDALATGDWTTFHEVLASIKPSRPQTPRDIYEFQCETARRIPWRAGDFPAVAAWLEQNETPLELAVEASGRPRFFFPLVPPSEYMQVMSSVAPHYDKTRAIGQALCTRAMWRLGEGDAEGAWEDVLATHRLARLIGQQRTLIDTLVSYAMEGAALEAALSLAGSKHVTPELNARIRRNLSALGPVASMADSIDAGERLCGLDATICLARYGGFDGPLEGSEGVKMSLTDRWNNTLVDWNQVLIAWNRQIDRIVAIARMPLGPERDAAASQMEAEIEAMAQQRRTPSTVVGGLVIGSQRTKYMQSALFTLMMPTVHGAVTAERRTGIKLELAKLSFAVAAYRQDHGEYPACLADLAADDTTAPHIDPFSGAPYVFKTESSGFVLYSVGEDKQDDGGRTREEAEDGQFMLGSGTPRLGHDYPVRVPPRVDLRDLGLRD